LIASSGIAPAVGDPAGLDAAAAHRRPATVVERLEIIDALPMTLTGKVQKFALRELALETAPGKPR